MRIVAVHTRLMARGSARVLSLVAARAIFLNFSVVRTMTRKTGLVLHKGGRLLLVTTFTGDAARLWVMGQRLVTRAAILMPSMTLSLGDVGSMATCAELVTLYARCKLMRRVARGAALSAVSMILGRLLVTTFAVRDSQSRPPAPLRVWIVTGRTSAVGSVGRGVVVLESLMTACAGALRGAFHIMRGVAVRAGLVLFDARARQSLVTLMTVDAGIGGGGAQIV